jgi:hypothetical protein
MSLSFAFESQDFCCAENLIFLAVTSAFRLDNLYPVVRVPIGHSGPNDLNWRPGDERCVRPDRVYTAEARSPPAIDRLVSRTHSTHTHPVQMSQRGVRAAAEKACLRSLQRRFITDRSVVLVYRTIIIRSLRARRTKVGYCGRKSLLSAGRNRQPPTAKVRKGDADGSCSWEVGCEIGSQSPGRQDTSQEAVR